LLPAWNEGWNQSRKNNPAQDARERIWCPEPGNFRFIGNWIAACFSLLFSTKNVTIRAEQKPATHRGDRNEIR
jgi:hypothetical protein